MRYISATEYIRKKRWCEKNGWTEPFCEKGSWFAFPPNTVIPQKISWTKLELLSFVTISVLPFLLLMLAIVMIGSALFLVLH